jgi:hypothetical protein
VKPWAEALNPPMPTAAPAVPRQPRTALVGFKASPDEVRQLREVAAERSITVSAFIREALAARGLEVAQP